MEQICDFQECESLLKHAEKLKANEENQNTGTLKRFKYLYMCTININNMHNVYQHLKIILPAIILQNWY